MFDFETRESRLKFIHENESGIYNGKNVDDEEVYIFLNKGKGMRVDTRHTSKPDWWECVGYDKHGFQEDVTYAHDEFHEIQNAVMKSLIRIGAIDAKYNAD